MPSQGNRDPDLWRALFTPIALGLGLGVPVLARLLAVLQREAPYVHPRLDAGGAPDWHPWWTSQLRILAEVQDEGLAVLTGTATVMTALFVALAMIVVAVLVTSAAQARKGGMAIRAALGASAGRLTRELAGKGGRQLLPGVAAAAAIGIAMNAWLGSSWPVGEAPWGGRGWWSAGAGAGAAVIAVGAASWFWPALVGRTSNLRRHLGSGERATPGPLDRLGRDALIVVQVVACLTLLTAAGLLVRAFVAAPADGIASGGETTVVVGLDLTGEGGGLERRAAILEDVQRRVAQIPGVMDTSLASSGALVGIGNRDLVHALTGSLAVPGIIRESYQHSVGPDFFQLTGATLLEGREFTADDRLDTDRVVVVNFPFADRVLLGNAVGKQIQLGNLSSRGDLYTVVGVVEHPQGEAIGIAPPVPPAVYLPAFRHPPAHVDLAIRTSLEPERLAEAVKSAVAAAGPATVLGPLLTLDEYREQLRAPIRWFAVLLGFLGSGALLLAGVGTYGVVAASTARRTRELEIRRAVGATGADIVRLVVGRTLRLYLLGALLGLGSTAALSRLLASRVHGVGSFDPLLYLAMALLMAGVAVAGSLGVGRRVARGV